MVYLINEKTTAPTKAQHMMTVNKRTRWSFGLCIPLLICMTGCTLRNKQGGSRRDSKIRTIEFRKKTPQKRIKDMTLDEAITASRFYQENNNTDLLLATYQQIIAKSQHQPDIAASYIIKLADFYLGISNFDDAKKQYRKVINLYPGFIGIERARYREVVTHFWSSLGPKRDQTATRATITLGKQYLEDFKDAVESCDRIKTMIAASYRTVLEHEQGIVAFYIKKYFLHTDSEKPLRAALQRLEIIRAELLPELIYFIPEATALQHDLSIPETYSDDLSLKENRDIVVEQVQERIQRITTLLLREQVHHKQPTIDAATLRDRF